jgi:hypothetical protein
VRQRGTAELLLVWAVYAVFGLAIVITYARLPEEELYHVGEEGLRGGLGRALVFSNFPVALVAVAVLLFAADRLPRGRIPAAAGFLLCWITAAPGVVDRADLDAKWVNVMPALGVVIALALTVVLIRERGLGSLRPRLRGDGLRVAAAVVLVLAGLPWLFAEAGFYADDVPGLGAIFMSDELSVTEDGLVSAVHIGEHHGTDGMLLALTAILLSRLIGSMRSPRLRSAFAAYLALMLVYGVANAAQDGWLEQVVKRGWSDVHLPEVLHPEPTFAWAVLIVAAAAVYVLLFRRGLAGTFRPEKREERTH